ncbi:MAG: hypothetical protein K2M34_03390 [Alphaproteobacteria bacterium]|nr:hypothetical protein [Alphaproteobacteria bacterium]
MKEHNHIFEQVTPNDIDSHGALRIPYGKRIIPHKLMGYIRDCGFTEISYYADNRWVRAPITFIEDEMYVVVRKSSFAGTELYQLSSPEFCQSGLCGERYYALRHGGMTYFDENARAVIKSAREDMWKNQIIQAATKMHAPHYAVEIIAHAINKSIEALKSAPIDAKTRKYINGEISRIQDYFIGINRFCANYRNNDALDELSYLNLHELANIVLPVQSQNLGKTYTRYVKRRLDNPNHVRAMMDAGYRNPGCFPYQWLQNTPPAERGALTDTLHSAFQRAARDLYSPVYMAYPDLQSKFTPVLSTLARSITDATGVNTNVQYYGHGFFSKTYKITSDNQAYILKVYHSDLPYFTMKEHIHDIEAQISFLVSGKKYCGNVRYRTVLTAGISNQRGMQYILYPFVDGVIGDVKHNPYDVFKTYHFCDDIGTGNQCGNKIIDTGMIKVNECRIGRPYMTKIINTILYRPWDDLAIVLNKYNAQQISESVNFISQRLDSTIPHSDRIYAKLQFLARKINIR